jgi:hypothetical protein
VPSEAEKAAIDKAANAPQIVVLLAARIETDQEELRRAVARPARSLATLAPKRKDR